MTYPLMLPSDLEVAESLVSHLPHADATSCFCMVIRALGQQRRARGIPRQPLPLETPVSDQVLRTLDHPMPNTALRELSDTGFPNLATRLRNEWLTNLAVLTPAPLSSQPQVSAFLERLNASTESPEAPSSKLEDYPRRLPSDADTIEAVLPALADNHASTIRAWLSQHHHVIQERRDYGLTRPSLTHETLTSVSDPSSRETIRKTLSPLPEMGFGATCERLITDHLLEVKTLARAVLRQASQSLDSDAIASTLSSRYRHQEQ